MIVGCYTLHLYCAGCSRGHNPKLPFNPAATPSPSEYSGDTQRAAKREARKDGWKFIKGECWCRKCKP